MAEDVKEVQEIPNEADNLAGQSAPRDERIKTDVLSQVRRIVQNRTVFHNKWVVIDRLWRGDPMSRFYPDEQQTHIPEPYKVVQAATPRVLTALFPDEDWFRVWPMGPSSVDPTGAKMLVREQLDDGRFYQRIQQFVQGVCKYGDGFAKAPWVQERRKLRTKQAKEEPRYANGTPVETVEKSIEEKEIVINKDRTEFDNLSIFDFVFDWRFESIHAAPGCGDISRQNIEYIEDMIEQGYWRDVSAEELEELKKADVRQPIELAGKDLQRNATLSNQMPIKPEDDVKVLDWWGLIEIEDGKRVEGQVMMILSDSLENGIIVRIAVNNQWHGHRPYLHGRWELVEGEGYSIGLIEPIVRLCIDLNDNQNVVNAAAALIPNPMYKVGDDMDVYDEQIIASPGRVFRGRDVGQFQPLVQPDMTQVARLSKEDIRRDIDETTGLPRSFYGGGEKADTATEFMGKTREANLILRDRVKNLSRNVLRLFLEMCLYNNQQFLDEERPVLITGHAQDYSTYLVTPDKLRGMARVSIKLTPQIELMGMRGQMMNNFMQTLAALGPLSGQEPFRTLLKMVWRNEFGYEEIDEVFPPTLADMKVTQTQENLLMEKGIEVRVEKWHPHLEHMRDVSGYMATPYFAKLPEEKQSIFRAHFQNHNMYAKLQQESQAQELGMAPGGGMGTPGAPPTPQLPGNLSGNELGREAQGQIQGV